MQTRILQKYLVSWVGIMNYDERFRSDDSIRRFFFKLEAMSDERLRMQYLDKKARYKIFKKALLSVSSNNIDASEFKNIDLAFFPIKDGVEYYAVVMNFKHPSIEILDNRVWMGQKDSTIFERYNYVTELLQQMVVHHMKLLGHPSCVEFEWLEQEVIDFEWKTEFNSYDSGLFMMRHMETYMGDRNSWDSGLTKIGQRQDIQLDNLKKKYTAKIIQHESNLLTKKMLKEVAEYHKLSVDIRFKMQGDSARTRWKRILE